MADEAINGARGEVALNVGGVSLVIAAEMGALASLSTALGCKSFHDLYVRLTDVEVAAAIAGVRHLTIRGDREAALAKLKLKHFPACAKAFQEALAHHLNDEEGTG